MRVIKKHLVFEFIYFDLIIVIFFIIIMNYFKNTIICDICKF